MQVSLRDTMLMLANGAGAGVVLSFLFEKIPAFQNLSSQGRWWTVVIVTLGLPLLATALLQFVPADAWKALEPYWIGLTCGLWMLSGSQLGHRLDKS